MAGGKHAPSALDTRRIPRSGNLSLERRIVLYDWLGSTRRRWAYCVLGVKADRVGYLHIALLYTPTRGLELCNYA